MECYNNLQNFDYMYSSSIQPKLIHLGKTRRAPLTTLIVQGNSNVQNNTENIQKTQQPLKNSNFYCNAPVSTHFYSIKSPAPKLNQSSYVPFRIVRQMIGHPFQIRIPTSQLTNLRKQVCELRQRCQLLQKQLNNKNKDTNYETFKGICESSKIIEDRLEGFTRQKSQNSEQMVFQYTNSRFNEENQISPHQYEQVIASLQNTSSRLNELQNKNRQLSTILNSTQNQLQQAAQENIKLKHQIAAIKQQH